MTNKPTVLCTFIAGVLALLPLSALSDELMKWERIPLTIPLKTGTERVIFVDKNVRVGFPPALNNKLRVQSSGGAVYLKASEDFPLTRLHLQDVETGEVILLDILASPEGNDEPVKLIYQGEVKSLSSSSYASPPETASRRSGKSIPEQNNKEAPKKSSSQTPVPVLLTRYAAQSLYAPLRTIEAVAGIRPVNARLPKHITTLMPSEPVAVTPLASWGLDSRAVVALKLQNQSYRRVVLDPRILQGKFIAATFQHRYLGPKGQPEDTTTLYLVTDARPDMAFIPEPVPAPKSAKKSLMKQPGSKASGKEAIHAH